MAVPERSSRLIAPDLEAGIRIIECMEPPRVRSRPNPIAPGTVEHFPLKAPWLAWPTQRVSSGL